MNRLTFRLRGPEMTFLIAILLILDFIDVASPAKLPNRELSSFGEANLEGPNLEREVFLFAENAKFSTENTASEKPSEFINTKRAVPKKISKNSQNSKMPSDGEVASITKFSSRKLTSTMAANLAHSSAKSSHSRRSARSVEAVAHKQAVAEATENSMETERGANALKSIEFISSAELTKSAEKVLSRQKKSIHRRQYSKESISHGNEHNQGSAGMKEAAAAVVAALSVGKVRPKVKRNVKVKAKAKVEAKARPKDPFAPSTNSADCIVQGRLRKHDERFTVDECNSNCRCENAELVCNMRTCQQNYELPHPAAHYYRDKKKKKDENKKFPTKKGALHPSRLPRLSGDYRRPTYPPHSETFNPPGRSPVDTPPVYQPVPDFLPPAHPATYQNRHTPPDFFSPVNQPHLSSGRGGGHRDTFRDNFASIFRPIFGSGFHVDFRRGGQGLFAGGPGSGGARSQGPLGTAWESTGVGAGGFGSGVQGTIVPWTGGRESSGLMARALGSTGLVASGLGSGSFSSGFSAGLSWGTGSSSSFQMATGSGYANGFGHRSEYDRGFHEQESYSREASEHHSNNNGEHHSTADRRSTADSHSTDHSHSTGSQHRHPPGGDFYGAETQHELAPPPAGGFYRSDGR